MEMRKTKMAKKNAMRKLGKMMFLVVMLIIMVTCPAYAEVEADEGGGDDPMAFGMSRIDAVISWIVSWAAKIGLVVAFFGGIQVALGFMNDDADSKVSGMKTLAAGFMVFGICMAADELFFVPFM